MRGGSAGGYTTLAALTFRKYFAGGASYYGISDISALAKDTHKFEAHYLDWLIGSYPTSAQSLSSKITDLSCPKPVETGDLFSGR